VHECHADLGEVLVGHAPIGCGRVQRALECVWPRFMWSSVYGASGIETGHDDAFATLLLALRNRRDHPGVRPPSADGGAAWIEQHCRAPVRPSRGC
jgi:hypothetical protein